MLKSDSVTVQRDSCITAVLQCTGWIYLSHVVRLVLSVWLSGEEPDQPLMMTDQDRSGLSGYTATYSYTNIFKIQNIYF